MPIKGLTDRGLAFPEIGQIRKGAKKGENRPGADLKHFRVEFDETEKKTADLFHNLYKEQYEKIGGPQFIRIIFPFNEIERMWDAWKEAYTAGRMVARSDGEYIIYQLDDQGEIIVKNGLDANGLKVPHPIDNIAGFDYKENPVKFKNTGRLKVIIPELSRAAYLTFQTTSTHDIGNISDQLRAFHTLNNGVLAGIPFMLRRRMRLISTPSGENGQRVRRAKSLVCIEADPEWVRAKLNEVRALAMPQIDESLLLPSDTGEVDVLEDEDEDEVSEFMDLPQDEPEGDIKLIDPLGNEAAKIADSVWDIGIPASKKELERLFPKGSKPLTAEEIKAVILNS